MAFPNAISLCWLVLVALLGCHRDRAPAAQKPTSEPPVQVAASLPAAQSPKGLVLEIEPLAGSYQLHIQNRGAAPVKFASRLTLERKHGDDFDLVSGQRLSVFGACGVAPTPCLALASGAERMPPPFRWVQGDMQCSSDGATVAAGDYRIVLHGCAGDAFALASASISVAGH